MTEDRGPMINGERSEEPPRTCASGERALPERSSVPLDLAVGAGVQPALETDVVAVPVQPVNGAEAKPDGRKAIPQFDQFVRFPGRESRGPRSGTSRMMISVSLRTSSVYARRTGRTLGTCQRESWNVTEVGRVERPQRARDLPPEGGRRGELETED